MLQLWGSFLIAVGLAYIGFVHARTGQKRVKQLELAYEALEELSRELSFRQTALPTLFRNAVSPVLKHCGDGLKGDRHPPVAQVWQDAFQELTLLRQEEQRAINSVGRVLGRYDTAHQCSVIETVAAGLHDNILAAQEESVRSGRVSRALGLAAGSFVFILLL